MLTFAHKSRTHTHTHTHTHTPTRTYTLTHTPTRTQITRARTHTRGLFVFVLGMEPRPPSGGEKKSGDGAIAETRWPGLPCRRAAAALGIAQLACLLASFARYTAPSTVYVAVGVLVVPLLLLLLFFSNDQHVVRGEQARRLAAQLSRWCSTALHDKSVPTNARANDTGNPKHLPSARKHAAVLDSNSNVASAEQTRGATAKVFFSGSTTIAPKGECSVRRHAHPRAVRGVLVFLLCFSTCMVLATGIFQIWAAAQPNGYSHALHDSGSSNSTDPGECSSALSPSTADVFHDCHDTFAPCSGTSCSLADARTPFNRTLDSPHCLLTQLVVCVHMCARVCFVCLLVCSLHVQYVCVQG